MAKRQLMDGTESVTVEGYTGRVKVICEGDEIIALACCAFALCENEATTTITNPILGGVPSCQRCADKTEALR